MIHKVLSLTTLVALVLVLVPLPAAAADPAVVDTTVTAAPFQVDLFGASTDAWLDRLVQSFSCDLQDCLNTCAADHATCITANRPNFVVCLALNDACITGCYSACS